MLVSLNYTKTTQDPVTENKHGRRRQKQVYFLICGSCFWCTSALSLRPITDEIIPKCPMCHGNEISTFDQPVQRRDH